MDCLGDLAGCQLADIQAGNPSFTNLQEFINVQSAAVQSGPGAEPAPQQGLADVLKLGM